MGEFKRRRWVCRCFSGNVLTFGQKTPPKKSSSTKTSQAADRNKSYLDQIVREMGPPPTSRFSNAAIEAGRRWANRREEERAQQSSPKKRRPGKDLPTATEGLPISQSMAQALRNAGAPAHTGGVPAGALAAPTSQPPVPAQAPPTSAPANSFQFARRQLLNLGLPVNTHRSSEEGNGESGDEDEDEDEEDEDDAMFDGEEEEEDSPEDNDDPNDTSYGE